LLQAQLRGKLSRDEENMEDLLTSNVFGAISYVSPQEGLIYLLRNSKDFDGKPPAVSLEDVIEVEYSFWPWISEKDCIGCEPDVLIRIKLSSGKKIVVLIEAKYLSDKSSIADDQKSAPYDQLAREYDNLQQLAIREGADPLFMYVTADMSFPKQSFLESRDDYFAHKAASMQMYWLSWRTLPTVFQRYHDAIKRNILDDMIDILRRQGLTFYEGITPPKLILLGWSFNTAMNWNWLVFRTIDNIWKFQTIQKFNWKYTALSVDWRFGE
jgi:hypothetical protein